MLRICPKCSAYYADESLAFCLADGMPLLSVAPDSKRWQEGLRALEEKTQAARKQRRKVRWRRLILSGMTTLIMAMVVSRSYEVETIPVGTIPPVRQAVFASHSTAAVPGAWPPEFLLPSESPSPSTADSSTPTTESTSPTSTTDSSSPTTESTSPTSTTDTSTPTTDSTSPTSTADTSHSPTVVYKISGRVTIAGQPVAGVKVRLEGSKATTATTDGGGYYAFSDLRAGGSYSVTPLRDKTNFKPFNRSFDNLTQDGSADFNGDGEREPERDSKPESKCTEADEDRERKIIIDTYGAALRESVERERRKVIAENIRDGEKAEATLVPRETYIVFFKECKAATITYTYVWQIRAGHPQEPPRNLNVSRQRTSICGKMRGRWFCS